MGPNEVYRESWKRYMDHEMFYYSELGPTHVWNEAASTLFGWLDDNDPHEISIWCAFDAEGYPTRCGLTQNLNQTLSQLEQQSNEKYLDVNVLTTKSWRSAKQLKKDIRSFIKINWRKEYQPLSIREIRSRVTRCSLDE